MSAVCKEKRVCFFFLQNLFTVHTQHTHYSAFLSLYKHTLSLESVTTTAQSTTTTAPPPPPPPPHHHRHQTC
ncbi:hypothetical protein Hanom_Chr00s000006g01613531 [Helianthus anomalus]